MLLAFLSFNSYMGIKVSFFLLLVVAFLIKAIYEKKPLNFKSIFKAGTLSLIITSVFIFLMYISPGNQSFKNRAFDEILFFNRSKLEHVVWYERYVPTTPDWIKRIVSNKLTVIADSFLDKYLKAYDPRMLFFKGDPHPLYGTYYFGLFYLIEFALIFVGLFNAHKVLGKKIGVLIPFVILLLVSPLPTGLSTITDVTIVFRAYPLILPLSLFIAMGGYYFLSRLKKHFYAVSLIIYIIAFSYFFFVFQTKIKYFSSEQWHYSQKVLDDNLNDLKNKYKKVYLYTNESRENALLYSYYQVNDARLIKDSLNKATDKNYRFENIYIQESCPKEKLSEENFYIIKRDMCDVIKNKNRFGYKLTPYIEAYDHSGTLYWQLTNLKKDK